MMGCFAENPGKSTRKVLQRAAAFQFPAGLGKMMYVLVFGFSGKMVCVLVFGPCGDALRSLAAQTNMGEDLASVHLAAMADPDDQHKKPLVLNFANEAIVPDAEAPKLCQFALQ